ncbi:MAG: sulfatase-like hydrolase/transferase [Dehalococcoidia bacterium]|nr:sulfatase-like hydrolase/transferase [Dehalococcoidia bacterium]
MQDRKPNILFILTDQQRRDSMRAYGNEWIQTPNLDKLADKSFVFENAYVTQPVCTPARASIMTGLYPYATGLQRNNIPLSRDIQTIGDMIDDEYYNAHMGKWHLGDDMTAQHGFDTWEAVEDFQRVRITRKEYRYQEAPYNQWLRDHGVEPPSMSMSYEGWVGVAELTEEQTQAGFLGHKASEFISEFPEGNHADQPWMLYVNFFEPHPPYTGPMNDLYDPNKIDVGPGFRVRPDSGSLVNRLRSDYYMGGGNNPLGEAGGDVHDTTTEEGFRKLRAQYFANVTLVDTQLGKIFESLEESGQADNTIIVFTSEHGEMAGDHGMLEKRSLYEEASNVPFLMHVPWLNNDKQIRLAGSVGQVDLVPTLLDLSGSEIPDHIEGKSLCPVLRGDEDLSDNDVFIQWNGMGDRNLGSPDINRMVSIPWRGVVTGDRWKLNLSPGDQCELYDLNTDRAELNNLFNKPEHIDRIRKMAARIRIWQDETGDDMPLPAV